MAAPPDSYAVEWGDPELNLPALRDDLQLLEAAPGLNGAPNWTVFDPIRNSYFRIGWLAFQCLSRWGVGRIDTLLKQLREQTTASPTLADIKQIIDFLYLHELTQEAPGGGSAGYEAIARNRHRQRWLTRLKGMMFVRIPLWRPKTFLPATIGLVRRLVSRPALFALCLFGLSGLFLLSRQWDVFVHSFSYFYNPAGIAIYLGVLALVKVLHELGHAWALLRYTHKTPTIGFALLVMVMPILYTDATDVWRLKSRRQRLVIGAAGMAAELYVAVVSTWLWCLLPDGPWRSVAFVFASSSWVMSLVVNLNPLMRFDGYYLFSDWLGVENLLQRSGALGRWQLRRLLFATPEPMPDPALSSRHPTLVIYAWLGWVYRFLVYLGIALLVYHLMFKLLGIALFFLEIYLLIVRPVVVELALWWQQREVLFSTSRAKISLAASIVGLVLLLLPWHTSVRLPAMMQVSEKATLYAPVAGRVKDVYVSAGDSVVAGQRLMQLEVPAMAAQTLGLLQERELLQLRVNRRVANAEDLEEIQILYGRLEEVSSQLTAIEELTNRLKIDSPLTGVVREVSPELHVGRWVNPQLALMFVAEPRTNEIVAWVHENQLARIQEGVEALFIPDQPELPSVATRLNAVRQVNSQHLDVPYLASEYGGDIAVTLNNAQQLVPINAVYRAEFEPVFLEAAAHQITLGEIKLKGRSESFFIRAYRSITRILVREWGF